MKRVPALLPFFAPEQRISVVVYDVGGRLVRKISDKVMVAGSHRLEWDATRMDGNRAKAGMYFVRLEGASGVRVSRVAMIQ